MQGEQGIRGPQTATPGGSITINVGTNDASVDIMDGNSGEITTHPVTPGKDTTIQVPNVPGGTILQIIAGKGARIRVLEVEVISTGE